jgi:hypothetical protein
VLHTIPQPPPGGKPRLRLAPPAAELPDTRAAVARALLERYVPVEPVISDEMLAFLGWDIPKLNEIESDPRYLIGRLTQALAALLAEDVPPLDATATLLTGAIRDAMAYRQRTCPKCGPDLVCAECEPGWQLAHRYWSLYGQLGLIENLPPLPADLKAAGR